jgi:hypothetical protein
MKKIVLSLVMMMSSICLFAQETYEIKKVGSQYTTSEINAAFTSANLCGSYFQSKRNILVFIDGSEIELKSKSELQNQGITLAESCFLSDETHYFKNLWSIAENGMIMKGFDTQTYPTEKEYYHYNNINKQ